MPTLTPKPLVPPKPVYRDPEGMDFHIVSRLKKQHTPDPVSPLITLIIATVRLQSNKLRNPLKLYMYARSQANTLKHNQWSPPRASLKDTQ